MKKNTIVSGVVGAVLAGGAILGAGAIEAQEVITVTKEGADRKSYQVTIETTKETTEIKSTSLQQLESLRAIFVHQKESAQAEIDKIDALIAKITPEIDKVEDKVVTP